ncbi:MAG: hypothetical protein HY801_07790 [Candidatus Lindowbacteria bacterium]|nr:hypothetical protein [Candidatus Lindowbacteria bacterium]
MEEPGVWCFDAIIETRVKKLPSLESLLVLMKKLGFETTPLSVEGPTPEGLKGCDDYEQQKRVALLSMRTTIEETSSTI